MTCSEVTARSFADYWCGELDAGEAEAFEEHLFECAECAALAEGLALTAVSVREATRLGDVSSLTLTRSAIERLEQDGVPVRHYVVHRGETVACRATPDHFSLVHLRLDEPAGERRIDLGVETSAGDSFQYDDVAINHADGEVSLAWPGYMVRAQPTGTLAVTVTAVVGAERRVLGEYRLAHSADGAGSSGLD